MSVFSGRLRNTELKAPLTMSPVIDDFMSIPNVPTIRAGALPLVLLPMSPCKSLKERMPAESAPGGIF